MVGGLALGDYAWVHEDMLNQVLGGQLPRNDNLADLLDRSVSYIDTHLSFFLNAEQADDATRNEIERVKDFVQDPEALAGNPVTDSELMDKAEIIPVVLPVLTEVYSEQHADNIEVLESFDFPEPEPLATEAENIQEVEADGIEPLAPFDFPEPVATEAEKIAEVGVSDLELFEPLDFTGSEWPVVEENQDAESIESLEPVEEPVEFSGSEPVLTEAEESQNTGEPASSESVEFSAFEDSEEQRIVWEMFKEELPDQLLAIDQQMQRLAADPGDAEVLKELERELHTLKGSSRMAQLTDMGNAAHEAEELLEGVRRERGRILTKREISKLQSDIDQIGALSEQYVLSGLPGSQPIAQEASLSGEPDESGTENKVEEVTKDAGAGRVKPEAAQERAYESYLEQVLFEQAGVLPDLLVLEGIDALSAEQAAGERSAVAPPVLLQDQEQIRISAAYLDKMVESSNTLNITQNAIRERLGLMEEDVGEFGRTAARLKQLLRSLELETETQVHAGYRGTGENNRQNTGFDPLEMDEYSEIQRLSRALAESLNDLVNIEGDLTTHLRTVDKFVSDSALTGRELHQNLLTTRLVEVSTIIPRLRRIMRQVATEFGREVSFEIDGEALKLDRYLLQRMTAPIEHILRNAVFHGIETPDERTRSGKNTEGGVLLEVAREDTDVVFRISDDGRGLDKEKIRAKALEQGLVGIGDQLSDQDIYKLVLRSGFSTVTEANQVAGRGVGMDVVNSEIKALGGSLLIDSHTGSGSEFTVRLPFTMAANPVLFVVIQKQQYALPLSGVQGLARLTGAEVKQHLSKADAPLMLADQPYTLQYLGDALGYPGCPELRESDMHVVIHMSIGGHHIAWLVDAINGRHEVVLQSLGALFKTCRFYSAATVTSDGEVIMVPDMLELTEQMMAEPPVAEIELTGDKPVDTVVRHENPHILIVDDSITVRKVTEKLLVNENFVVDTAKDGLEALEKLAVFEADLVLLDIEMPRMDGFEVLSAVRNEPRWQDLPVIMISSRTAEKHLLHAKELGASDFLGKPYQNQDLLAHIFKHLEGYPMMAPDKVQMTDKELA